MARKDTGKAHMEQEAVIDGSPVDTGAPELSDGYDQIVEEAPGIGPATDMPSPKGDPGDLSALGRSALLPDDLDADIGNDSGFGGAVDPGAEAGSTLLDDVGAGSDLPNTDDGFDGLSDGWSAPVIDDQSGTVMDDVDENDRILAATSAAEFNEASDTMTDLAIEAYEAGDDVWADFLAEAATAAEEARQERVDQEALQSDDGPPESETMPAPDDGQGDPSEGGELDIVAAGFGAVDPAPETEDQGGGGGLDIVAAGLGAVDPIEDKSSLLGGDEGDLAEMAADGDRYDVEVEFDDSLAEAEIGEDV